MISFRIKYGISVEEAWTALKDAGMIPLYSSEDEKGHAEIVIEGHSLLTIPSLSCVEVIKEIQAEPIDWEAQWTLHAKNYSDGHLHISLANGRLIKLKPGPGFGDLSHPTTELVLNLIFKQLIPHRPFIDVGCGSGILAICASALGAYPVWAIDRDPEALQHAKHNAEINEMDQMRFILPEELKIVKKGLITLAMNMISSEQEIAWKNLPCIHNGQILTSGILKEQKSDYLALTASWGWEVQEICEKEGWLGFKFLFG